MPGVVRAERDGHGGSTAAAQATRLAGFRVPKFLRFLDLQPQHGAAAREARSESPK